MTTLPKNVSQKLTEELINSIYDYDDTYKKMYDKVIYNFYADIFQDRKMCDKIFSWKIKVIDSLGNDIGMCNLIAQGARDIQQMYLRKNNNSMSNHIDYSLYVS